jgi:hypothetical protein
MSGALGRLTARWGGGAAPTSRDPFRLGRREREEGADSLGLDRECDGDQGVVGARVVHAERDRVREREVSELLGAVHARLMIGTAPAAVVRSAVLNRGAPTT